MKAETRMDATTIAAIPEALQNCPQWVVWRNNGGRKTPYQVNALPAKTNDPTTWTTCEQASEAARGIPEGEGGIGYVFSAEDDFIGIDLDGCVDESGQLQPWANEIIEAFGSYAEFSPSGTGVKIFALGKLPDGRGRKMQIAEPPCGGKIPGIEIYDRKRYFTVTGRPVTAVGTVNDAQEAVDDLLTRISAPRAPAVTRLAPVGPRPDNVIRRARAYLEKVDPAISGQGGHNTTFRAACALILGFDLSPEEAYPLLAEYNERCEPPWSERELVHKLATAAKQPGQRGILLGEEVDPMEAAAHQAGATEPPPGPSAQASGEGTHLRKDSEPLGNLTFVDVEAQYVSFPTEVLPPAVQNFVNEGARAIGCDPALVAIPVLVSCAGAIGNSRQVRIKNGWNEPPVLWAAIVAGSGEHKSPAIALALKTLRDRQRLAMRKHQTEYDHWLQYEMATFEADSKQYRSKKSLGGEPPIRPEEPICWRVLTDDVTIEALAVLLKNQPKGLTLVCDELASWVSSFERYKGGGAASDAAKWLELHGARMLLVDRKNGNPKTLCIPHAAVSVCGGIQPDIMKKLMTPEYRASGLSARILLARPPSRQKQWTDAEIDDWTEKSFGEVIDALISLEMRFDDPDPDPKPQLVQLSPKAREMFIVFYNQNAQEQMDVPRELASTWSKLEGYAARLALIVHLMRWACREISDQEQWDLDSESMAAGVELARWFANEARRVNDLTIETPEQRDRRESVEWIRRQGGSTTPREMAQKWWRYRGQTELARTALSQLVKSGVGQWERLDTGGRPSERFRIFEAPGHLHLRKSDFPLGNGPFVDARSPQSSKNDATSPSILRLADELQDWQ